ncbi:MAG: hypothetical protein LBR83_09775 [Clostridiales bacterium]|jgi:hypothetical protein|nr:hypothetical protein [Clostridiales bacterium]
MPALVAIRNDYDRCAPYDGYASWQAVWEEETGREFGKCAMIGCRNEAEEGVQVFKHNDKHGMCFYIVPLCAECLTERFDSYFRVNGEDMVLVDE